MFLYIDFETTTGPGLSLSKLSLREYLSRCAVRSTAWAVEDGPVEYTTDPADPRLWHDLTQDGVCVVAHNASFDVRVITQKLQLRWPPFVHCTMELAQAWSPNQPGGYSLDNLAKCWLTAGMQKVQIDLDKCTPAELEAYNKQDVEVCRALHKIALSRLPPEEIRIHELTQNVKEIVFDVDSAKVAAAVTDFTTQAVNAAGCAVQALGDDSGFNYDSGVVRSVKPAAIKRLMLDNLGFDTPSITQKKINPEKLRANPEAAAAIGHIGATNKALSHQRRVRSFASMTKVDCELTYYAAHTGRWSSRNTGKGLNLHNLPKRNPAVSKPIRSLFRLPDDLCFVRGDFANVEYRMLGRLSNCAHTAALFAANPLADPYAEFWTAATGQKIDKANKADVPKRQLAKAAVLGLGYLMGTLRWANELLIGISDPTFKVTLADLDAVCKSNNWGMPVSPPAKTAMTKLRCPWQVASVAEHTRDRFHSIHPEFGRLARWLEHSVQRASSAHDPAQALYRTMMDSNAPDQGMVKLTADTWLQGTSVTATVGGFMPTVTWRDLAVRTLPQGAALTFVRAGSKPAGKASVNVLIENITQSASRNALADGLLILDRMGYPYVLHVHDEVLMVVPRTIPDIWKARYDMLKVFGPGGELSKKWGWSAVINPKDVGISASLYEDEAFNEAAWANLLPSTLQALP